MDRIEAHKFQVDALQKKYGSELNRRESVRASLAVPIAVLSFAAFGFASLAATAVWVDTSVSAVTLSTLVLMLAVAATFLLFSAIFHVGQVRLTSPAPDANVLEFADYADSMKQELIAEGSSVRDAHELSIVGALTYLSTEYDFCTDALVAENRTNLQRQQIALSCAAPGVGCLILALSISTWIKVVGPEVFPVAIDQNTVQNTVNAATVSSSGN